MWIDDFKIAIYNEDINKIIELFENMPDDLNMQSLEYLPELLNQAIKLLEIEKTKTAGILLKLKSAKQYSQSQNKTLGFNHKY